MAVRPDVTLNTFLSPRLLEIAAPSTTINVPDLLDTLRSLEAYWLNLDDSSFVDDGGNDAGVTGRTLTLLNLQVLFEARSTKLETGTVTTPDTKGRTLNDSTALFQTNGVSRADIVLNATDGSHSTVLDVSSETSLTCLPLVGGTDNQFGSADSYEIFDYVQCSITGGNVFAVDAGGSPMTPVLNTFGVGSLIVEQSTSPAAQPLQAGTIIDGTNTAQHALRVLLATLGGKVSGVTTSQEKFRNPADTKDRVTVTLDVDGNRTNVQLDMSD